MQANAAIDLGRPYRQVSTYSFIVVSMLLFYFSCSINIYSDSFLMDLTSIRQIHVGVTYIDAGRFYESIKMIAIVWMAIVTSRGWYCDFVKTDFF